MVSSLIPSTWIPSCGGGRPLPATMLAMERPDAFLTSLPPKLRITVTTDMDRDYEVGRGKPPRHTRFKKGQSGNPKGRPRGSENRNAILTKLLNERVVVTVNGRRKTITKKRAFLTQAVNRAMAGEFRYTQLVLELCAASEQFEERTSQLAPPRYSNEKRQSLAREVLGILIECGEIKPPEGVVYEPTVAEPG